MAANVVSFTSLVSPSWETRMRYFSSRQKWPAGRPASWVSMIFCSSFHSWPSSDLSEEPISTSLFLELSELADQLWSALSRKDEAEPLLSYLRADSSYCKLLTWILKLVTWNLLIGTWNLVLETWYLRNLFLFNYYFLMVTS